MSTSPFDDANASFAMLVNHKRQGSLWATFAADAVGWRVRYSKSKRAASLDYIEQNWTDIRPRDLQESVAARGFLNKPPGLGSDGAG